VLNYLACGKGVVGITTYMMILLRLALRYGWINVIHDSLGRPISAAFWLRPGCTRISMWYQLYLLVRYGWRVTGLRHLPRMIFDLGALERAHTQAMRACGLTHVNHVYLLTIVTREDRRGEGLAARIMRPAWDECDRTGTYAYLEASGERNALRHYPKYGFRMFCEVPLWQLSMLYPAMVRTPEEPPPPSPNGRPHLRLA
jgi:GNAT superfamily N-acetyltransferase